MHLIVDLARDLAIVAIELLVLIFLGWCLSRNSGEFKGKLHLHRARNNYTRRSA